MKQCRNCLLPEKAAQKALDTEAVCHLCRENAEVDPSVAEAARRERVADLELALRQKGPGDYDCLVCLSGGKDSVYLLHKVAVEYGRRVLAFVTDMNIPEVAWANINRTIEKLGVDLYVYRPPREFYRRFFRYLLQNQNEKGAVRTVCYVCAPLFEGYALRVAVEKNIPLVLAGYSPGQPDPERMVYEYPPSLIADTDWTPDVLRDSGLFSESDLARFWNPKSYPAGTRFPRYLAPFHAWPYDQAEVMKRVVDLGLIESAGNANPIHSNCPINWLLMYSDLKNLGYNPYNPEFSRLIREGRANRLYWKWALPLVNFMIRHRVFLGRHVEASLRWLGLNERDLKIRRRLPAAAKVAA